MKIVFFGTPFFAATNLEFLHNNNIEIVSEEKKENILKSILACKQMKYFFLKNKFPKFHDDFSG